MKRVQRPALPSRVAQYLVRQQQKWAEKQSADAPDMEAFWKSRRATRTVGQALKALQQANKWLKSLNAPCWVSLIFSKVSVHVWRCLKA